MSTATSPLAPRHLPDMPAIAGVRLATAAAGIRYAGRTDVLLTLFEPGTTVAGVFTRSKCPSAPVEWCRAHLKPGKARALVVNSGNANAFTGQERPRRLQIHRADRRACDRLQTGGCLSRLDRCDRRAVESGSLRRRDGGTCRGRAGRRFPRCRARDHDHRHISKSGNRHRENRQSQSDDQRHRQGRGHDCAGHGHDAVICFHRRGNFRGRTAGPAQGRRRPIRSTPSRSMATPRPPTR